MNRPHAPLRICHIASGDGWGGLEALVLSLVQAQHTSPDFEVSLVVLNDGRLARDARELGVTVRMVAESQANAWRLFHQLEAVLRDLQPDIVHTHRYKENFYAYLLAPHLGIRHVVTLHGFEPPTGRIVQLEVAVRDFISFRLARRAHTRFAAVSRDLQLQYRVPDHRCTVIPNGIPLPPLPPAATNGRAGAGLAPVIGWAGRMVPIKSLGTLLDAAALLHSEGELRPTILLLGDGPERAALTQQAKQLGIDTQVRFMGFVDDLAPYFAQMDLFVLPSLHEGVPLALLEAMAAGVPVIAAGVGGIQETIGDSGAAHLMGSHSPAEWADAIRRFSANREGAREMANKGRALVARRFSLDAMMARYAELYQAAREH